MAAIEITKENYEAEVLQSDKPVLLDFWASWCVPCVQELPFLKSLYQTYHEEGLDIVSVSLDTKKSAWEAAVKKHQIPVSYRLRSAETKRLLETETAEQFVEFVRQTAYFRGKQAVLEPEDELTWERVMIRTYEKICKKHPMSVAPVLRYLYEKEHEIDLLTTALEGIRYRIPPYEIRDLIFAM